MTSPHQAVVRVMLVEDSSSIRTRLLELLTEVPGLEIVGVADDAAGAMDIFQRCRPDAAVLDIRIRNGSGIALLDQIKQQRRDCVVIMLTSLVHQEYRQRCLAAGADHFLEKSREFSRVAKLLRQLQQRKANEPE
jgi:two-component system OmpR family response regulator